jgi:peptide/nickel transport system substrate-binding protein
VLAVIAERRSKALRWCALSVLIAAAALGSSAFGASTSPQRGGTLRVGIQGSSATETNNPFLDSTNGAVLLRRMLVYDAVTKLAPDGRVVGAAAGSWRYNRALTELRFTVRKGERFSDGTPVTPRDIAYSLRLYGKIGFGLAGIPIDWPKVTVDGNQVVAPLLQKRTDVAESLAQYSTVVKAGTKDFSEAPAGSGPFKIDILEPGSGITRLVRNPFYPRPTHLDAIDIQSFADPATETTAFLAGDLDVAIDVGGVNARRAEGAKGVKIDRKVGAVAYPFVMRVGDPPFNNPAVRLALKLAVDRPALVKDVLEGWGTVGNDLFMPSDPNYDSALPQRKRDLKRAARLLESAGYTASHPLKLTLWSTTFAPEMASAATLFVEQLNSGLPMVKAKVQMAPADTYWTDVWLNKPFYTSYLQTFPLTRVMYDTLGYSRGAYNETGMHRADFDALVKKAVTTTNPVVRKRALFAAQKILHDQGGYIVWGYADEIDLARVDVHGLPTAAGKARYSLWQAWLSK